MGRSERDEMVMSYNRVRIALGMLGIALPVMLLIGGLIEEHGLEPTISDFFHTTYRDVYVGALCAIGIFLISYRGHRREPGELIDDDWLATLAGLSAFGMAFFPTKSRNFEIATFSQKYFGFEVTPVAHYVSALVFFVCLAAFCFVKFAKTSHAGRRRMYRFCGWIIVASLCATAVAAWFKNYGGGPVAEFVVAHKLIFWFEAIGVWAFALSWLTKAKADQMVMMAVSRRRLKQITAKDDESVAP